MTFSFYTIHNIKHGQSPHNPQTAKRKSLISNESPISNYTNFQILKAKTTEVRPGSSDSNLGKSLWRLQHVERKLADIEGTSRDFIASTNDDKIFSPSNAFLAIFTQPKYRSNPSRQPETREYTSRGAFARAADSQK